MALVIGSRFAADLEQLRADLDAVQVGLGRLVGDVGRKKLAPLVAEVQQLMPFDPLHRGWPPGDRGEHDAPDPGHIRDSVKGGSRRNAFVIYTSHPGGPVHWWGGTIQPRGHAIQIHHEPGAGEEFSSRVADEVVADVEIALDELARKRNL